jgi:hypothetical protein
MSDPHEQSGISVTIKGDEPGGKYNDPKSPGTWIVFHGTPARVREQIIEVFELPAEASERPLFDLVNEATKLFKGAANVSKTLGGTVLNDGQGGGSQPASGDVWDQAAAARNGATQQQEEKPAADPILTALENCKTVAEVQQVWAENQAAFNANPDYMAAYKAKGKSLS